MAQKSYLFQSVIAENQPFVLGGRGIYLTVEDPVTHEVREIIDGNTSASVGSLGHGDPDIVQAMKDAAEECAYSFPLTTENHNAEDLAQFIVTHSPKDTFAAAVFVGSGSEANENMLRLVYQYHIENGQPQRSRFISRNQSYHGFTIGSISIADSNRFYNYKPVSLPAEQCLKVSECYEYQKRKPDESLEQYKDRLVKEVEDTFISAGPDTIGAFICETVSGSSLGCATPVPGYLEGIRDICHKYGALFVLDEVMCGMGRAGTYHAWEQFLPLNKGPDIQTIGKTLGSGYVTIAGVLVSPAVRDVFVNGSGVMPSAHTYQSHSFNCKVTLAVQKKIFENNLIENSKKMGDYLNASLKEKLKDSKIIGDIRGVGTFQGVELIKDKATKEPFDPKLNLGHRLADICYKDGMQILGLDGTVDGKKGDHMMFSPAYTVTKEEIDKIVSVFVQACDELEKELGL
ncbi:PLP-dependent transferase [Ascoidea rubescens DSM 1968]|uniref:PLP-dependent transferase n=1 Tax=Ascoidea rubescens DSM 1968 TaxID=1344418 RepID=A0A1D2VJP0_9ASCO|nr:PLP-dependent transferase [Ascoidea rubescens DSM 1968]ODV61835.1 PLP-dependent transferase [Ascoidea rubescens DSM 1968]